MLPLKIVNQTLKHLPPLLRRQLLTGPLGRSEIGPELVVGSGECLVLWTADLLAGTKAVTETAILPLIQEFSSNIMEHGNALLVALGQLIPGVHASLPIRHLSVCDTRYVTVTGSNKTFDLEEAELHASYPPAIAVATASLGLSSLWLVQLEAATRLAYADKAGKEADVHQDRLKKLSAVIIAWSKYAETR